MAREYVSSDYGRASERTTVNDSELYILLSVAVTRVSRTVISEYSTSWGKLEALRQEFRLHI